MTKPKKKTADARKPAKRARAKAVREGGRRLRVPNSGLQVWLYDEANRAPIQESGAMDFRFGSGTPSFADLTRDGLIVGYSLQQDDDLDVAVHVGKRLTKQELLAARWLEPQTAFLRLPSGMLCVESNDASRVGPEEPTEKGARVKVPPGNYRLTLYRVDHEALFRDGIAWDGPQEVIVLTKGGTSADAADDLLPFESRRDMSWVGRYTIAGSRADALVWFSNYWDTFVANLDSAAAAQLSLAPGSYLRTDVPATGLTFINTFAKSWSDAERLSMPSGVELAEYGYAALQPMSDWGGAEVLFCRRERAKARVEDQHQYVWLPAVIEVLATAPAPVARRGFTPSQLSAKQYFHSTFLSMVLSEVLPGVANRELPLDKAVARLDEKFAKMNLTPQHDVTWHETIKTRPVETTARLYAGLPDTFAAILAADGTFHVIFLSELADESWVLTGLADDMERRIKTKGPTGLFVPHPKVRFETIDEPLAKIYKAHNTALREAKADPVTAPASADDCLAAFERFLTVAFG